MSSLVIPTYAQRRRRQSQHLLHDTFTAADNTLIASRPMDSGDSWTAHLGAPPIVSNRATFNQNGQVSLLTADAGQSDVDLWITVNLNGNTFGIGPLFRYVDLNNHWLLYTEANQLRLYRVVGGGYSNLASYAHNLGANQTHTWHVRGVGNVIRVFDAAESQIIAVTDSAHASATRYGIQSEGHTTASWAEDFIVDQAA